MNDLDYTPQEPGENPFPAPEMTPPQDGQITDEPAGLFQSWSQPEAVPLTRTPHLGHLVLLTAFLCVGAVCATVLTAVALRFHFLGVAAMDKAATEVHYMLGSEAVIYLVTLALSLIIFPLFWNKSFFAGIQWRGAVARRLYQPLALTALGCFALAALDIKLLPGPEHAPIDEIFRTPGAAWLLFAFGITLAPFFEEIVFRGFLLPALATACDWVGEYIGSENQWPRPALVAGSAMASTAVAVFCEEAYGHHRFVERFLLFCFISLVFGVALFWMYKRRQDRCAGLRVRPLDENGHPQWSIQAMVIASIAASLPFALMHAEQTGHSLGPLLQVFSVSLILCAVRLKTRSLAASTLVHACYNFLIFSLMMLGTGGFRHLDKM
jgi:membrane protease YdiL (CAAX protease family)